MLSFLYIIQKLGIIFLIHQASNCDNDEDVGQHQQMEPNGGDGRINDNLSEIADEKIDRVQQKKILNQWGIGLDRIEHSRQVHQ